MGVLYALWGLQRDENHSQAGSGFLHNPDGAHFSHEWLGFNRAMLFLVNEKDNALEGVMGIGPHSAEEAGKRGARSEDINGEVSHIAVVKI